MFVLLVFDGVVVVLVFDGFIGLCALLGLGTLIPFFGCFLCWGSDGLVVVGVLEAWWALAALLASIDHQGLNRGGVDGGDWKLTVQFFCFVCGENTGSHYRRDGGYQDCAV